MFYTKTYTLFYKTPLNFQNLLKKFLKKNNINVIYFNKYINLFLYHELMHIASSEKDGNIYYSGFDKYPVNIT